MRLALKPAGAIIPLLVMLIIVKAPFLLLLLLCALVFCGVTSLGIVARKPRKKLTTRNGIARHETEIPKPKIVKIDGVGHVEWITDIRQLEYQSTWNLKQVRQVEEELLRTDPSEWIKMGEKVALSEEEALNKPEPASQMARTRPTHNLSCRCQDCWKDNRSSAGLIPLWEDGKTPITANNLNKMVNAINSIESRVFGLPKTPDFEVTVAERAEPIEYYYKGGIVQRPETVQDIMVRQLL